jgi:sec-independent protein translocase protein TatC
MGDEPGTERLDELEQEEGGPVKSFLEHLEDLRWVLIKSLVGLGVAVLICLIAGNVVVTILKWPLHRAKISYPGTNQVLGVWFGTNKLGVYHLSAAATGAIEPGNQPVSRFPDHADGDWYQPRSGFSANG